MQEPSKLQQPTLPTAQQQLASAKRKSLASICGIAAATILCSIVPQFEGTKNVGYLDPIGIPTKCTGDTRDVVVGRHYTDAECAESLQTALIAHAEPILRCNPELQGRTYQLAASVSFGYNIGTRAFCDSQVSKRFHVGEWKLGCKAMNESDSGRPQWVMAGGKVLPGLVKRRAEERALCETGLTQ